MRAAAEKQDRKRWAVGCLALGLLAGLGVVGLGGLMAFEITRDVKTTPIDLNQRIPSYETSGFEPGVIEPGRLVLEVEGIDLSIEPGPPGSPIRVRGGLDLAGFELKPEYATHGERGWTYKLRARPNHLMGRLVRRGGSESSIRITLPRATPIHLEGIVHTGNTRLELGGLWIVETDLEFGAGGQHIAFSQPLPAPMKHFNIDAPVGKLTLVKLGNASPRHVRIDKNVGDVCLDLAGAWQADTTIEIACGVGSCDLHEPGELDAVVRVAGGKADLPESDLPAIEVLKTGVLSDNVEISQRLPKSANSP